MEQASGHHGVAWEPGLWKRAPKEALFYLLAFSACCGALAGILVDSDGKEVDKWPRHSAKASVNVLTSLVVSFANVFLLIALNRGYEVAWWLAAMNGAELCKLKFDLEIQSNYAAFLGRFRLIDKIAIASLVSLVVSIADGPLIQEASNTKLTTFVSDGAFVTANVSNATFPEDFSGFAGIDIGPDLMTPIFSNVSRAFSNRDGITIPVDDCANGTTCVFSLPAPGFDASCTESNVAFNLSKLVAGSKTNNNMTIFDVSLSFGGSITNGKTLSEFSTINISTLYKPDTACGGNLVRRECVLRLAIVQYNTTVLNGTATLDTWVEGRNDTVEFPIFPQPYALPGYGSLFTGSVVSGGFKTMLGGVYLAANSLYKSSVNLGVATMTTVPYILTASGSAASSYLTSNISTYADCTMTWDDPTSDIVNTIRELMFRSAIAQSAANETAVVPQQLVSRQTRQANTYQSHYDYLGITIAVMVAQALAITLLLYGWHRLGRKVSLDHFEVARTLGAPLLQQGSSNANIDDCLNNIKHVRLKYGEVPVDSTGSVSPLETAQTAAHVTEEKGTGIAAYPVAQSGFGTPMHTATGGSGRLLGRKLALHEEGQVSSIRPGTIY